MRTEEEIREMIDMLNGDIHRYECLDEHTPNKSFNDLILIFKAQRQILLWALGEDM